MDKRLGPGGRAVHRALRCRSWPARHSPAPGRPRPRAGHVHFVLALLLRAAGGMLLAGCGDQVAAPPGGTTGTVHLTPASTSMPRETGYATLPEGWPTTRPEPPSTPPETTGDVMPVAPWVTSTGRPVPETHPCTSADLTFEVGGWDAAMGSRVATLSVRNRSSASCYVDAYPTLLLKQGGGDLHIRTNRGLSRLVTTATAYPGRPPRRLEPHATAVSTLEWHAGVSRPNYEDPQELLVELGPNAGTTWAGTSFAARPGETAQPIAPFDVNSYDVIAVTAWS